MKSIGLLQSIGLVWFVVSIVIQIGTTFFFMLWLQRRGARLIFGLTGVPGYLEMKYLDLCRREGCNPKKIMLLRALSLINVLLSAIVVVPLVIMR